MLLDAIRHNAVSQMCFCGERTRASRNVRCSWNGNKSLNRRNIAKYLINSQQNSFLAKLALKINVEKLQ